MNEMMYKEERYTASSANEYDCSGCAFYKGGLAGRGRDNCDEDVPDCSHVERADSRSIIWVKAETSPPPTELKLKSIYVIGSLRNPAIPEVSAALRKAGLDVFDDWYAAGPEADDYWKKYEEGRGRGYYDAITGLAAGHVFDFDRTHLDRCEAAVLVLPAGRSGHLELGYCAGRGKPTYILHDNPDRWDVMYRLATAVVPDVETLLTKIKEVL